MQPRVRVGAIRWKFRICRALIIVSATICQRGMECEQPLIFSYFFLLFSKVFVPGAAD
jgi:hypothetical protein